VRRTLPNLLDQVVDLPAVPFNQRVQIIISAALD